MKGGHTTHKSRSINIKYFTSLDDSSQLNKLLEMRVFPRTTSSLTAAASQKAKHIPPRITVSSKHRVKSGEADAELLARAAVPSYAERAALFMQLSREVRISGLTQKRDTGWQKPSSFSSNFMASPFTSILLLVSCRQTSNFHM